MITLDIEAGKTERQYWRDIWRYRELFYFLAWRDLLVRYKQTVVGVAWSLIRPLLTMIVLTVVFGLFARMSSGKIPYALMVYCGMLPWQFFSTAMTECGNSMVGNSHLISKVYFPRLVVPASSVIVSLVDFLIAALLLVILLGWYRFVPSANLVFLPAFIVLALGLSFGVGLWIAALMVEYRDFRFIVPFVVQIGMYITPVGYSSSYVAARVAERYDQYKMLHSTNPMAANGDLLHAAVQQFQMLYSMNPMVGIIDGFRWCILGGEQVLYWPAQAMTLGWVVLLVFTGIWFFRRTERTFADVI